jgi:signal transduction histidine kinase
MSRRSELPSQALESEKPRQPVLKRAGARQRLQELDALYRADAVLHRSLRLDDVLQALVEVATELLNADKASVLVWDASRTHLVARAAHGYRADTVARLSFAPSEGITGVVLRTRRTVLVEDLHADPRASARINVLTDAEGIRSLICVPISVAGEIYGLFNASYCAPRVFNEYDSRPFEALAQRAALAIENARLFEQAQRAAALEERQRLARELHDAVTQTLFSASLIAEVLPGLLDRHPTEARERLDELRTLTRGALAEMRTLLLELRPTALTDTPLGDLLKQLAEATTGQATLEVTTRVVGQRAAPLPPEVQLVLYRIAQEALNNIAKHAGARHAVVELSYATAGEVNLCVIDDGRGFDSAAIPAGHMGVGIMRERVAAIGGRFGVDSTEGDGTRITVSWRSADCAAVPDR